MNYADNALLIYSPAFQNELPAVLENPALKQTGCRLSPVAIKDFLANRGNYLTKTRHLVCFVQAEFIRDLIIIAVEYNLDLGLLRPPAPHQPLLFNNFDIPKHLGDALELAVCKPEDRYDIVHCNDVLVLGSLNMGEFLFYDNHDISHQSDPIASRFLLFLNSFARLFRLTPQPITITTAKGRVIHTAVTGIAVVENAARPSFYASIDDNPSTRDEQISMLLLAPSSIFSYMKLLLRELLQINDSLNHQGLGYIKSKALTLTGGHTLKYTIDGEDYQAKELKLTLTPDSLAINAGPKYLKENEKTVSDKERVAVENLPQNKTRLSYLEKSLPFFAHALEDEFKDLFISLKESNTIKAHYLLFLVLSTLLASLGLFLDSPSIVIGAMVLAPLMAPIIALSMGLVRSDSSLTRQSLRTLGTGVLITLLVSTFMASALPYEKETQEILARINPSFLDLLVAIVSGIAGAYATAREHVAKSLPGVAIAVALVPPLCVSGIGLGWWNFDIFQSALLLFLTNLVGIILAASLTFLVLGFSPFTRAAKGVTLSIVMAGFVAVPLFFAFLGIIQSAQIENVLSRQEYTIEGQKFSLRDIHIQNEDSIYIRAALYGKDVPDDQMLDQLQSQLEKELEKPVKLDLSLHLSR